MITSKRLLPLAQVLKTLCTITPCGSWGSSAPGASTTTSKDWPIGTIFDIPSTAFRVPGAIVTLCKLLISSSMLSGFTGLLATSSCTTPCRPESSISSLEKRTRSQGAGNFLISPSFMASTTLVMVEVPRTTGTLAANRVPSGTTKASCSS